MVPPASVDGADGDVRSEAEVVESPVTVSEPGGGRDDEDVIFVGFSRRFSQSVTAP